MQKVVHVAVPPYLQNGEQLERFKTLLRRTWAQCAPPETIDFISQFQASWAHILAKKKISINKGDLIIMCLIEEDITVSGLGTLPVN